jgi:hypothetical protein
MKKEWSGKRIERGECKNRRVRRVRRRSEEG